MASLDEEVLAREGEWESNILTPVNAVPDRAQAKGSRYHGAMEMRYRLAEKAQTLVSTARQDLPWSTWKTCGRRERERT